MDNRVSNLTDDSSRTSFLAALAVAAGAWTIDGGDPDNPLHSELEQMYVRARIRIGVKSARLITWPAAKWVHIVAPIGGRTKCGQAFHWNARSWLGSPDDAECRRCRLKAGLPGPIPPPTTRTGSSAALRAPTPFDPASSGDNDDYSLSEQTKSQEVSRQDRLAESDQEPDRPRPSLATDARLDNSPTSNVKCTKISYTSAAPATKDLPRSAHSQTGHAAGRSPRRKRPLNAARGTQ